MRQVMVRYKLKPDRVQENEKLVSEVYDELVRTRPDALRYITFQLEDGVSFVHLVWIDTEDGQSPLANVEAFARFSESIEDRTDEPPIATELREIGSYRV
jgi:hypothetical protein